MIRSCLLIVFTLLNTDPDPVILGASFEKVRLHGHKRVSSMREIKNGIAGETRNRSSFESSETENSIFDSLAVHKSSRQLLAFSNKRLVKIYRIALGENSVGPKQFEGDGKTPEGLYFIIDKNSNSDYHKNLGISYPDEADRAWAREFGRSAGGDIKIHGYPNGYSNKEIRQLAKDWTLGCIAVSNREIEELFIAVPIGTPISINP